MRRQTAHAAYMAEVALLVAAVAICNLWIFARPAAAHPSDFETLTIDLLVGPDGLEAVDVAANQSTSYQPFASTQEKRLLAAEVLKALAVDVDEVDIELEMSDRYHDAGFVIRFPTPQLAGTSALRLEPGSLQRIAADAAIPKVKLALCAVARRPEGGGTTDGLLSRLDVQASAPSRHPTNGEQAPCQVWVLDQDDAAFGLDVGPQRLAATGMDLTTGTIAATFMLLSGLVLLRYGRRRPHRD